MADQKLSELTELAATPAVDDEVYIRDVSEVAATESKRITTANLIDAKAVAAVNAAGISLAEAKKITFGDETLATTDHTYTGFDATMVAGENLVFGQLVYYKSDTKFWKADADAEATTKGLLAVAADTISADASGKFILPGSFIRDDTWNWTIGGLIYVSCDPTTTGGFTQTAPSASADCVRIVGYAVTADVMWFEPDGTWVEIA